MIPENVEKTLNQIWQNAESDPSLRLHAILDGARDTRIYSKLAESRVEAASLFRGEQAKDLAMVAPYLVPLDRGDPFTEWLATYGWGNSWGIFVESSSELDLGALRRHFQSFIMVYDPAGRPLFFRYYDPRVLRVYLPTCNESELGKVFGPINAFWLEAEDPRFLMHYSFTDRRLVERTVPLY